MAPDTYLRTLSHVFVYIDPAVVQRLPEDGLALLLSDCLIHDFLWPGRKGKAGMPPETMGAYTSYMPARPPPTASGEEAADTGASCSHLGPHVRHEGVIDRFRNMISDLETVRGHGTVAGGGKELQCSCGGQTAARVFFIPPRHTAPKADLRKSPVLAGHEEGVRRR